ncbi:MAG: hypothetical protein L0216_17165 [Planctomycetales bacterium]|nr:hypothetical protein [Planctomycetales bacterium]
MNRFAGSLVPALIAAATLAPGAARGTPRGGEPGAAEVFAVLDRAASPTEAARQLESAGADAALLAKLLRAGRPLAPAEGRLTARVGSGDQETECRFLLPPRYDPAKKWPLLVGLHGLGGNADQAVGWFQKICETLGWILACPSATAPPDAEPFIRDMLWKLSPRQWWSYERGGIPLLALAEAKRRFNVDEDRVFLAGYSMGGFGSWNVGLRHWDRFAAIAPMAGGISPAEGMGGRNDSLRRLLENSRSLPIFFAHPEKDRTVPVMFDRWTAERLKELGTEHLYWEIPGAGHIPRGENARDLFTRMTEYVKDRRRRELPRAVRHTALAAAHGFAGWIRADQTAGEGCSLEADFPADPAARPIAVRTTGARALSSFVPEGWASPGAKLRVTVNGQPAEATEATALEALCDSWLAREDRTRVFARRLAVAVPGAPAGKDFAAGPARRTRSLPPVYSGSGTRVWTGPGNGSTWPGKEPR